MTKKRATGEPVTSSIPDSGKEGEGKEAILPFDPEMLEVMASTSDSKAINLALPRAAVEQILGNMMSAVSQRAYNAKWITGTEISLPFVVGKTLQTYPIDGGAYTWGQTAVEADEAQTLLSLAQALEYWVTWDEESKRYIPYRG